MSTLTITDDRTGKQYKVPIQNGAIPAMELRKIKVSEDDFGLDVLRSCVYEHCVLSKQR
jgi:hypothetical protein